MAVDYSAEVENTDDVWAVLTFGQTAASDGGPLLTNPTLGKLEFLTERIDSSPARQIVLVPAGQKTRVCVRSNEANILTLSAEAVLDAEDTAQFGGPPPPRCFGPCPPYGVENCDGMPDCSTGNLRCI